MREECFLSLMQRRKIQSALCNSIWKEKMQLCVCVCVRAEGMMHIIIMMPYLFSHTHTEEVNKLLLQGHPEQLTLLHSLSSLQLVD